MLKKTVLAALLAAPMAAFAFPTTFSSTPMGGTSTVTFSSIGLSAGGSKITLTDADSSGTLNFGDTFSEAGMISAVAFHDAANNVITGTGLGATGGYELWAVFSPLVGIVTSAAVGPGVTTYVANFTPPSSVEIFYDTAIDGVYSGGTKIGIGSLPTAGSVCTATRTTVGGGGVNIGVCALDFRFDVAGITKAGVWTVGGTDVGNLPGAWMHVDMAINSFTPWFSPTYSTPGGTQTIDIRHTGTASFVPEPASLALMGVGLLGLGLARRRKADA